MNCESATAEKKPLPPTAAATVMQYSRLIKAFAERDHPDYIYVRCAWCSSPDAEQEGQSVMQVAG